MFSYFTAVSKVGEAISTLEVSKRIQINLHKLEKCPTSKTQFNKVNKSLRVGETIAQIQDKNKAVREEEKP